jgi:hypothetical protein
MTPRVSHLVGVCVALAERRSTAIHLGDTQRRVCENALRGRAKVTSVYCE